jgi:NitT/TauT family transport system substrate-binding protein
MSAVEVKPLQSNNVVISALVGGTVDASVAPNGPILNLVEKGQIKFLGWTSDFAPLKAGVMLVGSKHTLDDHPDIVKRFLTAYRKACSDIHAAFADKNETRTDGPTAPDIIKIIAAFTGQPPAQVENSAPFVQPDARIDLAAYASQIAWLRSQGLLKDDIRIEDLVDKRYALTSASR